MKTKNNETKVICPKCGAEFAIPEREHLSIGVVIAKDSHLGTISPKLANTDVNMKTSKPKTMNKAEEKIAALKAAGVNVDNLFSMKGVNGTETIARLEEGNLTIVPDTDPIFKAIMDKGTVPNKHLFRRWVMSQVFHMMTELNWSTKKPIGFHQAIVQKGFRYAWKMVVEEVRVQPILATKDPENFAQRNMWFNKEVVTEMCLDYLDALEHHMDGLTRKRCKGVSYVRLSGKNIFVSDLQKKVFKPLVKLMSEIRGADSPCELYYATKAFQELAFNTWTWQCPVSKRFVDAYKGAGSYFTMRNLILFHGCSFREKGRFTSQKKSIQILEEKAAGHAYWGGYCMFGILKQLLEENHIDIQAKMAEWRKK